MIEQLKHGVAAILRSDFILLGNFSNDRWRRDGSKGSVVAAQVRLQSIAQIVDQMKSVSNLSGLRSSQAGVFCIKPVLAPATNFHARMVAQAFRYAGC